VSVAKDEFRTMRGEILQGILAKGMCVRGWLIVSIATDDAQCVVAVCIGVVSDDLSSLNLLELIMP
jgi:hypothetical protein